MYDLNPALQSFWLDPSRYKALFGGRASSKSHDAAGFAVYLARNYNLRFLCARQFQNKIEESVYTLIKNKIEAAGWENEFVFTRSSIYHKETKSEFLFYGIARNLNEIKSTEGVDILWLEEAQYLTEEQWQIIDPTIRKQGSQIWLIWNPDQYTDFIFQNFVVNPPSNCLSRQINWTENPFLSETMLKVIYDAYRRDPKLAEHVYGGAPKMGGDKAIIQLQYVLAAIDAHKKLGWEIEGSKRTGFDIADDGDDTNAIVDAIGNVVVWAEEWEGLEDELLKSSTKVFNHAVEKGSSIIFDSIGVGAHAGSKFKELNESRSLEIVYEPFNAGGAVYDPDEAYMKLPHVTITNREHFSNVKAQMWDRVATRFRKTYEVIAFGANHPHDELISISSEHIPKKTLDKLKIELASPHKDIDGMGKFKVESKKDMREKRGIKSPNIADAFIMAMIQPKRQPSGFFDF
ncbi:terminase large subunit [Burkholderia phage BCSR52]|uniref:Terminase large subunit n=1 Tax=Burkholderia phage BCSR52 TaxID=2805748 RepID=A0A889IPV5_9CAUD|nr:terminase large subunit [Burkholderia phage BCSR52]